MTGKARFPDPVKFPSNKYHKFEVIIRRENVLFTILEFFKTEMEKNLLCESTIFAHQMLLGTKRRERTKIQHFLSPVAKKEETGASKMNNRSEHTKKKKITVSKIK